MLDRPAMRTKTKTAAPIGGEFDLSAGDAGAAAEPGGALSNAPEVTVSELSSALKRTVEERFGYVRLRGEISNYRGPHSSGHAYFSLKDAAARIDAVVWRTTFVRLRVKPEEGMDVVATGKVTTFPGKSSYQIVIETLEPAGIGALMAMIEERRRRFLAEGLFDPARKRALPFLPVSIGVVTSPTGAVIRDILHRIAGRFPRPVLIWPVRVQGEGSGAEVARAIAGFNALAAGGAIPAPQVLIVARGGGSLEDLWGFNDEAVIRAAAASLIPLVSAVGHETDWTLLDHAADLRAPTPTGAAELAVPVRADLLSGLDRLSARHSGGALRLLERAREALRASARALPAGAELLAEPRQRLDRAGSQLPAGLRLCADGHRLRLVRLGGRLSAQSPQARLARAAQRLDALHDRLERARIVDAERRQRDVTVLAHRLRAGFAARLGIAAQENRHAAGRLHALTARLLRATAAATDRRTARLGSLGQMLGSLGYRSVLARGFALVRDEAGRPLRRAQEAADAAALSIEFADGMLEARHKGAAEPEAGGPARLRGRTPRSPSAEAKQGSLF